MADDAKPTGPEDLKQRLLRDEIRLAHDEERIEQDERWIQRNWRLALALGGVLALTVLALVLSVIALNRDIDTVASAAPRDGSVGTAALQDAAVTAGKLAEGAVTPAALAGGAVTRPAIADGAVTSKAVAANGLTGADIDEATLGRVPSATTAATATTSSDADALGGLAAGRYLNRPTVVTTRSSTSTLAAKGPLSATCPSGTRVVSGGASIDGAARVAITTSAPDGQDEWIASAAAIGTPSGPWTLEVIAVCAHGG
ncbi:MAG TPA: hypothetical protein PKD59_05260 [Miltoncostaeaceae bacterium]|nr:hypothetical protein [Miltoncostaeaceae bacterium]